MDSTRFYRVFASLPVKRLFATAWQTGKLDLAGNQDQLSRPESLPVCLACLLLVSLPVCLLLYRGGNRKGKQRQGCRAPAVEIQRREHPNAVVYGIPALRVRLPGGVSVGLPGRKRQGEVAVPLQRLPW